MKKRKWIYIFKPQSYEISCDKCGGSNITWSEFERRIWCFDCKIDTPGNGGIFSGPIPLEVTKMIMGENCFDRFYFKSKQIRKMKIEGNKLVWK